MLNDIINVSDVYIYLCRRNLFICSYADIWLTSVACQCGSPVWLASVAQLCGSTVWLASLCASQCVKSVGLASGAHLCGSPVRLISVARRCGCQCGWPVWLASVARQCVSPVWLTSVACQWIMCGKNDWNLKPSMILKGHGWWPGGWMIPKCSRILNRSRLN